MRCPPAPEQLVNDAKTEKWGAITRLDNVRTREDRVKRAGHCITFWMATTTIVSVIAADLAARPACAQAQDWPTHPMTLVVPFSAGGSSDAIARIVADGISNNLRQPVVVENVTGAGGLLGGSRVARSTPDGYQFVIGNVGTFAQSQ